MWALFLSPIVFHTFYYLRAPKVISTSLPALAILMALATIQIRNKTIKNAALTMALGFSILQSLFVLNGMGLQNSTLFYNKLASLKGVVSYSNSLAVRAISDVNPTQTTLVLGWDCEWIPIACNPDYSVVSQESYDRFDQEAREKWTVLESWNLKFIRAGSILYHLETYDSSPQKIMTSLNSEVFKENPINWLILKKKSPNE